MWQNVAKSAEAEHIPSKLNFSEGTPINNRPMTIDIAHAILAQISNFAVGFVQRVEGAGSRVLGSGVLVSIEGRRGILTCGHVAEKYAKLPEIGLVRFSAREATLQRRMLKPGNNTQTIIMDTGAWSEKGLDLAFIQLPPAAAFSIEAQSIFLNIEKNREKMEAGAPAEGKHVDAMLGFVAEFSEKPFVKGREFISPMRGMLHTGQICAHENGLLTFEAMYSDFKELPQSFGGMSGAGLWRISFVEDAPSSIIGRMLCGVASWQIDDRKIACQGWDRIDQVLIPTIRKQLQF